MSIVPVTALSAAELLSLGNNVLPAVLRDRSPHSRNRHRRARHGGWSHQHHARSRRGRARWWFHQEPPASAPAA